MALIKELLNKVRIGGNIDTYTPETIDTYPEDTTIKRIEGTTRRECPEGQTWSTIDGKCIPSSESPWGTDIQPTPCPQGQHWDRNQGKCVDDTIKPDPDPIRGCTDPKATNYNSQATEDDGSCIYISDDPDKPKPVGGCEGTQYGCCPDGVTAKADAAGTNCGDKPIPDEKKWCEKEGREIKAINWTAERCEDKPIPVRKKRWCAKENREIWADNWTISRCKSADPTPDDDDIDEETGGHREYIEDEGGDIGDFYDRFSIDYDPSRFGDYQEWLRGKTFPKQNILEELGVELKGKYKEFFADYSWFPESLAKTEFDVGRKGMTSDLFDLTRQSWKLRKEQGLLSGKPREFERLGMGQTGREFQAMDTAFRKDIFGMRKGFEEDTINRLLDLMKAGNADFEVKLSDYKKATQSGEVLDYIGKHKDDFFQYLISSPKYSLDQWKDSSESEQEDIFDEWLKDQEG